MPRETVRSVSDTRGLDAFLEAEKEKAGGDPEKEARAFASRTTEVDRKRAAYQDLVADGLMEREELRAKLDALSRGHRRGPWWRRMAGEQ